MKVSIKFCGGCNPRIDRVGVAAKIKDHFASDRVEVVYNSLEADIIVYISGCPSSCASRKAGGGKPNVTIAVACIDNVFGDEEYLSMIAIKKVRDYLEKLERPL